MKTKLYQDKILSVKKIINIYEKPLIEKYINFYQKNKINPVLAVVLTSNDPGSVSYVKGIKKFGEKINVTVKDFITSNKEELKELLLKLNNNDSINGIMVMYPANYGVKDTYFMNIIDPSKDIEGLNYAYLGYLTQYEKSTDAQGLRKLIIPPTAKGIMYIFKRYYDYYQDENDPKTNPFNLEGKNITIINDSLAVGRSLGLMLLNENSSVRICHKYTKYEDILSLIKISDIIISAVPSEKFIIKTKDIPENAIVIDISFEGNFEYPSIFEKIYKIAPRWDLVKKGNRINDMTLYRLFLNLFYLINNKLDKNIIKQDFKI